MKAISQKTISFSLGICLGISFFYLMYEVNQKPVKDVFQKVYTVEKDGQHIVNLINVSDTITMYVEDSGCFRDDVVYLDFH